MLVSFLSLTLQEQNDKGMENIFEQESVVTQLAVRIGYQYREPKVLFGTENAKTKKGEKLGYTTLIIYASPHKGNTQGKNMCAGATPGCIESCLFSAGRGVFDSVELARIHKTEFFLRDREKFMERMAKEIAKAERNAKDKICVRLNGTTDVPYEHIPVMGHRNIMAMFPNIQFYDYTKIAARMIFNAEPNYHLTFSMAETEKNKMQAMFLLETGHNVAAVFNVKKGGGLPETYNGYRVIDGDEHDLTFLHDKNVIVGLRAKGKAKKDTTGFVIHL